MFLRIEQGKEEQLIHGSEKLLLHKERWRLSNPLGVTELVRKYAVPGGPPVVLVHGFAQNRYTWHTSRRSLSGWLALKGYDVFNLELKGHGNSVTERPAAFKDYVDELEQVIDLIGVPAFWIGHSLGGAVAYAGATRYPMRGVIGIGALFRFAQANRMLNILCRLTSFAQDKIKLPEIPKGSLSFGAISIKTRLAGQLLGRLYNISDIAGYAFPVSGWAPGSIEPELLAERLEKGFDWTSIQIWLDMARWGALKNFDYEEAWKTTDVPLLVVSGDLDHLMLPDDARVAYDLSGSKDKSYQNMDLLETGYHWGHLDLILGKQAPRFVWPLLHRWMSDR
jgi:pimeloyl-ACP methyl ester carboxylesterase